MQQATILWVDDEIDLLKAHILFLEQKGFTITSVSNGEDAVEAVKVKDFDIIFLDENMPGMNGLEVLSQVKVISPSTPVVMITKSEEEQIMEDAIGSKIADYLIKPVNPNQILLACKKILDNKRLVGIKTNQGYQKEFTKIGMAFYDDLSSEDWIDIYRKLIFWELELEQNEDKSMFEVFESQKIEANVNFGKFVVKNYLKWMKADYGKRPLLSPDIMSKKVFPELKKGADSVFFLLVDCLRYDQWKFFEPIISQYYTIEDESAYFSILPTATQYARNAIFAGMFPDEIQRKFPKYWLNDDEEGGKNLFEADLLKDQLARHRIDARHSYTKIVTNESGNDLEENILNLMHNPFNAIVFNFIDMLSHARTEMNIVKELAPDEAAFRTLSRAWLEHSSLLSILRKLKDKNVRIVITTDHGTIKVNRPMKIIGDKSTTTNLRYKQGRNLSYEENRNLLTIRNPEEAHLPKMSVSASYVFTTEDYFFAYPNNYNHYVGYYKGTFQHGGISLEEMCIPLITLVPK
jgi:hypothetical protein